MVTRRQLFEKLAGFALFARFAPKKYSVAGLRTDPILTDIAAAYVPIYPDAAKIFPVIGGPIIGRAIEAATAKDDIIEVAMDGDILKLCAAGPIAAGEMLYCDYTGRAAAVTSDVEDLCYFDEEDEDADELDDGFE